MDVNGIFGKILDTRLFHNRLLISTTDFSSTFISILFLRLKITINLRLSFLCRLASFLVKDEINSYMEATGIPVQSYILV